LQGGKKRDARYRIKDDKYLLVDIKVPQEGQYGKMISRVRQKRRKSFLISLAKSGLEIYSREKFEEKMVHCCKYLINCDLDYFNED
jgi:hypothetical protein